MLCDTNDCSVAVFCKEGSMTSTRVPEVYLWKSFSDSRGYRPGYHCTLPSDMWPGEVLVQGQPDDKEHDSEFLVADAGFEGPNPLDPKNV